MAKVKALKPRSVYACQGCGHTEAKWLGRCPACQEWNTLVEELAAAEPPRPSATGVADGAAPVSIAEIGDHVGGPRRTSAIAELDRVLGGGLVAGSMVLLGGDPGVGKSTLLIQALAGLAASGTVLYATGEESVAQTAMRARRVGAARAADLDRRRDRRREDPRARARDPAVDPRGRLDPDRLHADPRLDPGLARAGPRVRVAAHPVRQDHRHADGHRRPRHQGRRARRPQDARAPRRCRAPARGRRRPVSDPALAQEPVRLHAGDRRVRDARRRHGRGREPVRAPARRAAARSAGLGRGRVGGRRASPARRDPGARRARAPPASAAAPPPASSRTGSRSCSPCSRSARPAMSSIATYSSTSPAASGSPSRRSISASHARSPRRREAARSTLTPIVFGEVGLAGEIRAVTLCEHRLAESARLGFTRALIPAQNAKRLAARTHPASRSSRSTA